MINNIENKQEDAKNIEDTKNITVTNNSFNVLNKVNVNSMIKSKMNLKYLSWAYAWGELLSRYPDTTTKIYEREIETTTVSVEEGTNAMGNKVTNTKTIKTTQNVPYFTDGNTCFVKVGVTVQGVEYVEEYPIMDLKNNAVRASSVTMTDVNKAIQRAFVKVCARHGLGLYIYAGEDLPQDSAELSELEQIKKQARATAEILLKGNQRASVVKYLNELLPFRISEAKETDIDQLIKVRDYLESLL